MPVHTPIRSECLEKVWLRWSEAANSTSREEFAELIQTHPTEALIRCSPRLRKDTQVYLIVPGRYKMSGVVASCRKEGNSFIVRIVINENLNPQHRSELDPGILIVDDFLTEEEEAKILKALEEDTAEDDFN
jgi:hypothetical protein